MTDIQTTHPSFDYAALKELVYSELKRNPDSDGYLCSIRGFSRLLKVNHSSLAAMSPQKNGLPKGVLPKLVCWCPEEAPESLKPILGFDYRLQPYNNTGTTSPKYLPEIVIQCVTEYYARDARQPLPRAQQLLTLFGSLGVRTLFAQILGDSVDETETSEQDIYLTPPIPVLEPTPVDKLLDLIAKLESYRFRREEIVSIFENAGLLEMNKERNTSYRGVVLHKKKWRAQININGSTRVIGGYETEEEAALAYDAYAKVVHGSKAKLNF